LPETPETRARMLAPLADPTFRAMWAAGLVSNFDFERYRETDKAFHECLVSPAHNERLLASYRRLNMEALIARARGDARETTNAATEEQYARTCQTSSTG